MLFASPLYGVFLLAVYAAFWALREHRLARTLMLTLASYVFYFLGTYETAKEQNPPLGPLGWSFLCLAIIFLGSTLDYGIGRVLGRTENPRKRKLLLLASITYYMGALAVFKYFNFFAENMAAALHVVGIEVKPSRLRLVLPFGISFFTFETMAYTIDVYRKEIEPAKRYLDYLLFVCYFPHLVAGPIVRPKTMLPQLAAEPYASDETKARGLFLIAIGLVKKIAIGDTLSVNLVGRVFDNPERFTSAEVLTGVYAYAIQIYADFSGYTDVAIGSALLFGYVLPRNFDAPYTARNLQDFWRRWHISLSSWLRDYLYVPLGGSRGTSFLTYRNLMITMILGGLWHGASWNFVIWGTLHGGGLAVNRAWQRWRGRPQSHPSLFVQIATVLVTFHFVCLGWIFFRAPTFSHALLLLGRIAQATTGLAQITPRVGLVLALGFATHFAPRSLYDQVRDRFVRSPALFQGAVLAAFAYLLHFAANVRVEPFVYGQF